MELEDTKMTNNLECIVDCDCKGCKYHKICYKTINLVNDAYFSRQIAMGSTGQELKKPHRVNYCLNCSGGQI